MFESKKPTMFEEKQWEKVKKDEPKKPKMF